MVIGNDKSRKNELFVEEIESIINCELKGLKKFSDKLDVSFTAVSGNSNTSLLTIGNVDSTDL